LGTVGADRAPDLAVGGPDEIAADEFTMQTQRLTQPLHLHREFIVNLLNSYAKSPRGSALVGAALAVWRRLRKVIDSDALPLGCLHPFAVARDQGAGARSKRHFVIV
jgi:hypothetical protein